MQAGKRAVERATKLTRQLTTFGRGSVSSPTTLDLPSHINEFRDLIEGALRENIALKFDMAEGLWPVYVDPVQLELAMLNAALNARDAMPDGGELHISARNTVLDGSAAPDLPAGEYVRIAVARQRRGHTARRPAARVRAVLYDQGSRQRIRTRTRADLRFREAVRRQCRDRKRARRRHYGNRAAAAKLDTSA